MRPYKPPVPFDFGDRFFGHDDARLSSPYHLICFYPPPRLRSFSIVVVPLARRVLKVGDKFPVAPTFTGPPLTIRGAASLAPETSRRIARTP